MTFAINFLLGGLDPSVYHATNVAIHAVAAIVLFGVLLALTRAPRSPPALARHALAFAFAGALIWAVHPVNTQAVSYVVQRMTSLAGLFYLATLWLFVQWRLGRMRARIAVPLMLGFWGLAMGSKLNAASAPAAWWLLEVAFFTGFTRRNLRLGGCVVAGGLAGAAWVLWSDLHYLLRDHPHYGFSGVERMVTEARVLWHYISLIVWPDASRLQIDYAYEASEGLLSPWTTLAACLAWGGVIASAVAAIHRRRFVWPATGALFFLIGSAVESSFVMLDPIFEHRIYLPSALLMPGLLAPLFMWNRAQSAWIGGRMALLALVALLTWQTIERNRLWAQPARLWQQALAAGAKEGRARANAGLAAMHKGNLSEASQNWALGTDAEASTRTGSASDAPTPTASPRSVRLAIIEGRLSEAQRLAKRELARNPHRGWAYLYGLALLYQGRLEPARAVIREMYARAPEWIATVILASLFQEQAGAPREARERLEQWLQERDVDVETFRRYPQPSDVDGR